MFRRSLKRKLFLAMLLLGVIPFSLSVAAEVYLTYRRLLAQAQHKLATHPLPVLRRMEALLYARWNDVHLLSHMPIFREPGGGEYRAAILRRASKVYRPYALVALADERGNVVASSDQKLMNTDAEKSRWFREARKISSRDWNEAVSSIYISEPYVPRSGDGRPVMCFNSPVYDFGGRFRGVLHSEVKLGILAPYLASLRVGETSRALLVREDGKILMDDRGALQPLQTSVADHAAFKRVRGGAAAVVRDRDIEGDAALVSSFQFDGFGKYPGVKWFLLLSQKESEIYAPIREMLYFHALAAFLGIGFIFLGGFILFDRNISKPLARLMGGVRSLATRGPTYGQEVMVRSKDEIGELASAFSDMVRSLAAKEQERKDLYEKLVQKERLAAIGEMVAGVAHQIKNPLATIKVASQLLIEKMSSDTPSRETLARIDKEVDRLNLLLHSFFDFAAPREPRKSGCELQLLVRVVLSELEDELAQVGVKVLERYADDLPRVFVDRQQMLQVMVNLFRNAQQAMPEGGILSVAAEADASEEEGGNRVASASRVRVRISDTGCGIAPEDLRKIFRPFFTTRASGTGLGLTLVYNVIQKHGGEVRASSRPGRGSTFELLLPVMETGLG